MGEALAWYLTVQVAALAVWPLVARALAPLDDRGWAVTKVIGVLGLSWLAWLVCMLTPIPFTRPTLLITLLGVTVVSWAVIERRAGWEALRWLGCRRRLAVADEVVFAATLVLFGVLRAHAPAISGTEKPMDMAFLDGFLTAQRLPTQDTWLAGFGVPYYYFGYFVLACVAKLSGVGPGVAYNLAAASVPALAILALAGLAWSLGQAAGASRRWTGLAATLAALLTMVAGNLSTFFEFLAARGWLTPDAGVALGIKHFAEGERPGVWPPDGVWWFHASRVIPTIQPDGINEFPFFSAFLADLHPHFVALPFEALALTVAAAHVLSRGATLRSWWTQGLAMLALGSLLVINTWDIAPFWLVYLGLAGVTSLRDLRRLPLTLIGPVGGALLFLPYFVGYAGPPLGLGIVQDEQRTPLSSLLVLFGGPLALLTILGLFVRWCIGDRRGWGLTGVGAAVGGILALAGEPTLGLLVALFVLLLPWPRVVDALLPAEVLTLGVAWFSLAMLLGVEVVFLDDAFHSRMNTVFKFHENAWILGGLCAGLSLSLLGARARRLRWVASAVAALALAGGLVYPLSAVATRLGETPADGLTLDGSAFLSPDESKAVRWLRQQSSAGGRPVVAEAVVPDYTSPVRMSTFSGAAAVLGWVGHELQWRGPVAELGRRQQDVEQIYRGDPDVVRGVLTRYGVRFVVVGDLERGQYGSGLDQHFEGVLPVAFRAGGVTIYRGLPS
jgi:YYY domain-containing protein